MSAYTAIAERLIRIIESEGKLVWNRPWSSIAPINGASGRKYRGINRVLLSIAPYSDPRWLTYLQAKGLGGQVRKGEKGFPVVFWRFPDEQEQQQGKPKVISRTFCVFNAEQCEGLSLPFLPQHNLNIDALEAAQKLIDGYLDRPRIVFHGERACYSGKHDLIQVPKAEAFESGEAWFNTIAHEACHSVWHPSRLDETDLFERAEFGSSRYAFCELVSELGAAFLGSEWRIANQETQSAAYLKSWLRPLRNNPMQLVRAAAKAEKAADWILGRRESNAGSLEDVAA